MSVTIYNPPAPILSNPALSGFGAGKAFSFAPSGTIGMFQVVFGATATGSVTLTRSVDGVNFKPYVNAQDQTNLGVITASGVFNIWEENSSAIYRIETALTAGSVTYAVMIDWQYAGYTVDKNPEAFVTQDPRTRYTTAQLQQQSAVRSTSISDADLAGDLTLYKRCRAGAFAKLLVPSAARRGKGSGFVLGQARDIRAEYVQVVSVFDRNGVALSSAQSYLDPLVTVYVPGQRVTARHIPGPGSNFDDSPMGIYGFLTLLEAVTMLVYDMREAPSNLSALGL